MKQSLKLLSIGLVANLNAQIIPSAQQTQQQQQTFYRDATAFVNKALILNLNLKIYNLITISTL